MVRLLRRNDTTIYQTVHKQSGFHDLERISHIEERVTDGNLEILAYVRVDAHDIHILDTLIFPHLIVETHGLNPTPVQGIAGTYWTLVYYRMRKQFGFLVKYTFPLYLDCSCYLL